MNIHDLIRFLHRVWCWMPHDNPVRKEMLDVQRQLKIAGVEHGSDMDQTILVYFGVEE